MNNLSSVKLNEHKIVNSSVNSKTIINLNHANNLKWIQKKINIIKLV